MTRKKHREQYNHVAGWLCEELSRCEEGDIPRKIAQYIRAAKEAMACRAMMDDPHNRLEDVIGEMRDHATAITRLTNELGGVAVAAAMLSQALAGFGPLTGGEDVGRDTTTEDCDNDMI